MAPFMTAAALLNAFGHLFESPILAFLSIGARHPSPAGWDCKLVISTRALTVQMAHEELVQLGYSYGICSRAGRRSSPGAPRQLCKAFDTWAARKELS